MESSSGGGVRIYTNGFLRAEINIPYDIEFDYSSVATIRSYKQKKSYGLCSSVQILGF